MAQTMIHFNRKMGLALVFFIIFSWWFSTKKKRAKNGSPCLEIPTWANSNHPGLIDVFNTWKVVRFQFGVFDPQNDIYYKSLVKLEFSVHQLSWANFFGHQVESGIMDLSVWKSEDQFHILWLRTSC